MLALPGLGELRRPQAAFKAEASTRSGKRRAACALCKAKGPAHESDGGMQSLGSALLSAAFAASVGLTALSTPPAHAESVYERRQAEMQKRKELLSQAREKAISKGGVQEGQDPEAAAAASKVAEQIPEAKPSEEKSSSEREKEAARMRESLKSSLKAYGTTSKQGESRLKPGADNPNNPKWFKDFLEKKQREAEGGATPPQPEAPKPQEKPAPEPNASKPAEPPSIPRSPAVKPPESPKPEAKAEKLPPAPEKEPRLTQPEPKSPPPAAEKLQKAQEKATPPPAPQPKAAPTPAAPTPKPEPKPEPRPQPRPEPKPEPKPQPAPTPPPKPQKAVPPPSAPAAPPKKIGVQAVQPAKKAEKIAGKAGKRKGPLPASVVQLALLGLFGALGYAVFFKEEETNKVLASSLRFLTSLYSKAEAAVKSRTKKT